MGQREQLVEMLKSVGQDLLDNAEDYIPTDTNWIHWINVIVGFEAG